MALKGAGRKPNDWPLYDAVTSYEDQDPVAAASVVCMVAEMFPLANIVCKCCNGFGHNQKNCATEHKIDAFTKGNTVMRSILKGAYVITREDVPATEAPVRRRLKGEHVESAAAEIDNVVGKRKSAFAISDTRMQGNKRDAKATGKLFETQRPGPG